MKKYRIKILVGLGAIVAFSIVFVSGLYIGYSRKPSIEKVVSVANKEQPATIDADFEPFWKVWNILNDKSIYANKITDQSRVWGAASGLASSLGDPYTVFFGPEESKLFNEQIHGSFSGIGAEIGMKDKLLTVIAPLKDTPAWKAGIKKGDKILKIDNKDTSEMTIDKAISLIHGKQGTVVTLVVLREGEKTTREFKITRDNIDIPTIETEEKGDGIFLIKFYTFSENSAKLFQDALQKFINSGDHKLIVDLRGNPGGYLDSAINIASWFLDEGKPIVIEDFVNGKKQQVYRSHGPRVFNDSLKLILLVDGGSASASEILAGALKENKIATLVGEKTFGKGTVQELINVTDDTTLKVTIARWLTPNGISISEQGLQPNIIVPFSIDDAKKGIDNQLNKAIELLKLEK